MRQNTFYKPSAQAGIKKSYGTPRKDTIEDWLRKEVEEVEANKGCSSIRKRRARGGGGQWRDVGTSRQGLKVRETISNHHPSSTRTLHLSSPFRPLLLFRISYRLSGRPDKTRRRELGEPSVARHDR